MFSVSIQISFDAVYAMMQIIDQHNVYSRS